MQLLIIRTFDDNSECQWQCAAVRPCHQDPTLSTDCIKLKGLVTGQGHTVHFGADAKTFSMKLIVLWCVMFDTGSYSGCLYLLGVCCGEI